LASVGIEILQAELNRRQGALPRLLKKQKKLAKALEAIEEKIATLGGSAPAKRGRKPGRKPGRKSGRKVAGKKTRPKNKLSLGDALAVALKGGKSMAIADAAEKVLKGGYKTNADNFKLIVNQTLLKDKRFRKAGRGKYALKQERKARKPRKIKKVKAQVEAKPEVKAEVVKS